MSSSYATACGSAANRAASRKYGITHRKLRFYVRRGEQRIEPTAKEFSLLSLLARHPGQILSRTMIAEQVWDMNFDCDSNVDDDVVIRRHRAKVYEPFSEKLILSYRERGYCIEPPE